MLLSVYLPKGLNRLGIQTPSFEGRVSGRCVPLLPFVPNAVTPIEPSPRTESSVSGGKLHHCFSGLRLKNRRDEPFQSALATKPSAKARTVRIPARIPHGAHRRRCPHSAANRSRRSWRTRTTTTGSSSASGQGGPTP